MTGRAQRRASGPPAPLAGLAALLVLLAAGYVVITAAGGLPWSRPYEVSVSVPDAQRLATNSEVRIRGVRVGRIGGVELERARGRPPVAKLSLEIDRSVAPLTSNAHVAVRAAATLGATYLDIDPAPGGREVPSGGVLAYHPLGRPSGSVTDLLDVFDASTRRGIRRGSREVAAALAGRGIDINQTIADLAATLGDLQIVADVLADPGTRTARFVRGLVQAATAIEPVAPQLRGLLASGATTFDAVVRERAALGTAIERAPAAVDNATTAITGLTPVLDDAGVLARTVRPSVRRLPGAARDLDRALRAGPRGLRALRTLLPVLRRTSDVLGRVARRPSVDATLQKLLETVRVTAPLVRTLLPAQLHCNVVPLWADGLSAPGHLVPGGYGLASITLTTLGAQNELLQNAKASPNAGINFLPHADASECEGGNEDPPAGRQVLGNPPGLQRSSTRMTKPPGDALERAREAGLLRVPRGAR